MNDIRVLLIDGPAPAGLPPAGAGWRLVSAGADPLQVPADVALAGSDTAVSETLLDRLALPLLVAVNADGHATADGAAARADLLDRAAGWWLPGDDGAAMDRLIAGIANDAGGMLRVADSSTTSQYIAALSAEARRIAEALEQLAVSNDADVTVQVNAGMVRRLIRLRRDRERHFPAEIFADPAWDMLLDLTAARMEGIDVPVSSLCVAAAVPTTTALRWIRTLSEAGLMVRKSDHVDARRSFITLSDPASQAMQAWIRRFATVFALR